MLVIRVDRQHRPHRLHCPHPPNGVGYSAWCECGEWGHWFGSRRDAVISHGHHTQSERDRAQEPAQ